MSTLTNGPWRVVWGSDNQTGNHPADIIGPSGHPIAHVLRPDPAAGGDYIGNARCLAAARELLGICQMVDRAYASPPSVLHREMEQAMVCLRQKVAEVLGQPDPYCRHLDSEYLDTDPEDGYDRRGCRDCGAVYFEKR